MYLGEKFKVVSLILFCGCLIAAHAQEPAGAIPQTESKSTADDDVIRIKTDLIQTGVAVFDKKGLFVKDLRLEDFELEVNGKPVSVSFFEENRAEKARTEKSAKTANTLRTSPNNLVQRGRNIIFVVDDLHLSVDSHSRTRKLIAKFLDEEMTPNDAVAIVSSTGKIGFLQQFTNDKTVLRTAVERLRYSRDRSAKDHSPPPMTEYEALLINQGDPEVTNIFAEQEIGSDMEAKREIVRSRARTIVAHMGVINRATYSTLEQAIRSSDQLPGRKIVFFISDGFLLDSTNTNASYLIQRVTDAAVRTNTVIYSFEAKGLEAGFPEGTTGRSLAGYRIQSGERFDKQDAPSSLANETGGRFIKNTNDLQTGMTNSIAEASQYYLLAWQPVSEAGSDERFRKIEVKVRNRPELKVRVHRGYLDKNRKAEADAIAKAKKNDDAKPTLPIAEQQLSAAATSLHPLQELPTSLAINFLDIPNEGTTTGVAVKIDSGLVEFSLEDNKAKAKIDVLGIVYDSDGKRERFFRELLTVDGSASTVTKSDRQDIYYNYQAKLKPGLYQVRVATRDVKSGRVGSAVGWVEIPDLSKRQLALSSLILSERVNDNRVRQENISTNIGPTDLPVLVDRRFARTSDLRYMIFVYNAAPGTTHPNVTIQTQILRDNQVVVTSQPSPISTGDRDPLRLPYAAEVSLRTLPTGRYELVVTVEDRIAKSSRAQRLYFEIK